MQTSEVKLELFRYIDNLEKSKLIQIYNHLILRDASEKEIDFWATLNDWQKNDIEAGISDIEKGKKRCYDEVMSNVK